MEGVKRSNECLIVSIFQRHFSYRKQLGKTSATEWYDLKRMLQNTETSWVTNAKMSGAIQLCRDCVRIHSEVHVKNVKTTESSPPEGWWFSVVYSNSCCKLLWRKPACWILSAQRYEALKSNLDYKHSAVGMSHWHVRDACWVISANYITSLLWIISAKHSEIYN